MKSMADFRQIARDALKGKWKIAVITGLIAALLGGLTSEGSNFTFKYDVTEGNMGLSLAGKQILSTEGGFEHLGGILAGGAIYISLTIIALAVVLYVLGSVIAVGYSRFNLDLVDNIDVKTETLFSYFNIWKTTAVSRLQRSIYVFLWSLLFIIPGIMASFSYAMTDYILADQPELTASEAIERSKEMMYGNRFRLFCLDLSFIGWTILCMFTLGVGNLWLTPYKNAAKAAFYREVSGTEYRNKYSDEYSTYEVPGWE